MFFYGFLTADITYDEQNRCIKVVDFPEENPAVLRDFLSADCNAGWGKVSYDRTTDTYTVDADIWIGDDKGFSTYFQIGGSEQPGVKLILRGSLWLRPAAEGISRSDGSPSVMNGLLTGISGSDSPGPTILFDCQSAGEHGLFAGLRKKKIKRNCRIRMVNTTIASLAPGESRRRWGSSRGYRVRGKKNEFHTNGCYVDYFDLKDCRFSDFTGCLFYGVQTASWDSRKKRMVPNPKNLIKDCVFENGHIPLATLQYLNGCEFRGLRVPVNDVGAFYIKAYNCVFEQNQYNWLFGGYSSGRDSFLIDCNIKPQSEPMRMKKNPKPRRRLGVPEYQSLRIMKTLQIKVIDATGDPVPMASVTVSGEGLVFNPRTFTNLDGLTDNDPQGEAIVVTVKRYKATDDPKKPSIKNGFKYKIKVKSQGKTSSDLIDGDRFNNPVTIRLK